MVVVGKKPYPSRPEVVLVVGPMESLEGVEVGCADLDGWLEFDGRNEGREETDGAAVGLAVGTIGSPVPPSMVGKGVKEGNGVIVGSGVNVGMGVTVGKKVGSSVSNGQ
jgi:acetyltransferase-like isoleucine patch superfamily enzyme